MISPYIIPGLTINKGKKVAISADQIIKFVCETHEISKEDLIKKTRKKELVKARFMAYWFIKNNTSLGLVSIGKLFSRDHSTVIHGIRDHSDNFERRDSESMMIMRNHRLIEQKIKSIRDMYQVIKDSEPNLNYCFKHRKL